MMNFFVILLLALDLRVFGFDYPTFVQQYSKDARVEVYSVTDSNKCPKIIQPLCGTNGKDFVYFNNKCYFEAKNYEQLTQGLMEYYECPLSLCESACPTCNSVNKPVCAVQVLTGEKRTFPNPCEVKRIICTTKKAWRIASPFECNTRQIDKIWKPSNTFLQNSDCPKFCTLEYRPICARFMTLEKEFSNDCELKTTICQTKQKWDIVKRGPCEKSNYNTVTEFYAIDNVCPRPCPLEYKPVCAKLHNKLKVFSNKCELENIRCQGHDNWQIINEGPCLVSRNYLDHTECPESCTKEYRPVCAAYKGEQRVFSNPCELKKTICESNIKWRIIKFDTCSANTLTVAHSCPIFCSNEYKPVCAKFKNEIREFSNKCLWEKWNCKSDKTWEIVNMGPCFSNYINTLPDSYTCPRFCPNEYKPVCAEFKSELTEFGNKCEMQKAICETNENWQFLHKGHCSFVSVPKSLCPKLCTKEFSPICARFNGTLREFINSCELEKSSCETETEWEIHNKGSCIVHQTKESIESSCANEALDPICVTYDFETKTFNNICQLSEEIKRTKKNWSVLYKGICSNISPATSTSVATSSKPTSILLETTTKSSCLAAAEAIITTTIRFKSTKYQTTEQATTPYETTIFSTTDKPKTTTADYSGTTYDDSEEYNGKDVVDSDSSSHEGSGSTENYKTNFNFSYEKNTTLAPYSSSAEEQLNSSHYYETKTQSNYNNIKAKHYTDNSEGYSKEDDATNASISEEKSTEIYTSYMRDNSASKRTSAEKSIYSNDNHSEYYKSNEKYKESKDIEKQYSDATKHCEEKNFSTTSKKCQQDSKSELKRPGPTGEKYRQEKLANNTKSISSSHNSGEVKRNGTDLQELTNFEGKNLTKWIKKQINVILSMVANSQSSEESDSDEHFQMPDTNSLELYPCFNPASLNEIKETKEVLGAYSSESNDKKNQIKKSKYNDIYRTSAANQIQASKYLKQDEPNLADSAESNLNIYKISLPKSGDKHKDNETLVNKKLTTLLNDTTVSYATNREESTYPGSYPSNRNSSKSKKGEIYYKGIVHKAPVYDAPTYNFIYTAPFNFHGLGPHHNSNSLVNQTNSGAATKVLFDPYHFLSSLPAAVGSFVKPNFMSGPTAMGYGNNVPDYKQLMHNENNQLKMPPSPFKSVKNKDLPQTNLSEENKSHYQPKEHYNKHTGLEESKVQKVLHSIPAYASSHPPIMPYHPLIPQQLPTFPAQGPLNRADSLKISLNSTLLKQIVDTLKIITNRY